MTTEEKKAIKEEKMKQEEKYMWAIVDGVKEKKGSNGFHVGQNHQVSKLGTSQKHIFNRDSRNSTSFNDANKVWTPKPKLENDEESCRTQLQIEETRAADQAKNMEVLIGSVSVAIGNCKEELLGTLCSSEPPFSKCNI